MLPRLWPVKSFESVYVLESVDFFIVDIKLARPRPTQLGQPGGSPCSRQRGRKLPKKDEKIFNEGISQT